MPVSQLGKLERVALRTAWQGEASDFTPWLASPENIRLLGDTLGVNAPIVKDLEPVPDSVPDTEPA